jgi:PAS domain S-box-containing protein
LLNMTLREKKKVKCWEFFECKEEECPVYTSKEEMCWLISGTHCRNQIQGKFLEKMEMCLECEPFRRSVDLDSMEATLKVVNAQFTEFRKMVDERDRELEGISLELALGLSEVFVALKKISSGDPLVRISETSELELISKLKHIVNLTAMNLAEIVDLSHEFAIGLAEHFNVLHRISKGDFTARVSGASPVELLESLKKVTNQMIESVSTEITEREHAEEALRESQERYYTVLEACPDPVVVYDMEGKGMYINPAFTRVFGWTPGEVLGTKMDYVPAETWPETQMMIDKLLAGESFSGIESRRYTKDGNILDVSISAAVYLNREGIPVGSVHILRDITHRKRAEEALRESEEKYSTLVENSLTGIYIDQDGKVVFANRRFAEIYRYPIDEIVGMETLRLVHPDDRALVKDIRAKRLTGEPTPSEYEARGLTKNGQTIWITRRNTRIEYQGRPAVLGNIVDVTQRRGAEHALQESQMELRRTHHELEAINSVLLRVTKEYDLNGMGRVLQDTMEAFYPKAETLVFLLAPDRDRFYFPRPERGQIRETCYDLAGKTIRDHRMEQDLRTFLTTNRLRLACSGRERADYPKIMEALVARFGSWMAIPIEVDGVCHGLVVVGSPSTDVQMADDLSFVESLIGQISGVIRYQIAKEIREEAFKRQLTGPDKFMGIVGRSESMLRIYRRIQSIADSESTVLITGESGTGKELVARVIHQAGKYKDTPFIAAHCSSFVPTLIHSELFGHEKGAFTGATSRKLGRLERANGGILFLDEVADLPLETQALLLRFLQDKTFERVGGEYPVQVNVRIIAASNKQLRKEMKANSLREDFYYRLNVIPIHVPPLRERITDLPILANHFLRTYCLVEEKEIAGFDTAAMRLMMDYDWPGNVRELQNTVARCVALASNDFIGPEELPKAIRTFQALPMEFSLSNSERNLIATVMRNCNWNKNQAARLLNISRGTLYSKIKRHNIHP